MARHRPTQPLLFVVFWRITPYFTGVREHREERTMLLAMGMIAYWVVLPLFVLWGAWGLWCLVRLDENRH